MIINPAFLAQYFLRYAKQHNQYAFAEKNIPLIQLPDPQNYADNFMITLDGEFNMVDLAQEVDKAMFALWQKKKILGEIK